MLIYNGEIIKQNKCKYFSNTDFEVYYNGIVFVSGKKEGKDSIEFIYKNILLQEHSDFSQIFGNYFIYIKDKANNNQYFFTDNSGIYKCYRYKNYISTSFLEIVDKAPEISIDNIDFNAVVEFFRYGFPYLNTTLIKDVERIDADSYAVIKNGKPEFINKGLSNIDAPCDINIHKFFYDFIFAIEDNKLSIDLTGGFDSRLILSFFTNADKDFELAISGLIDNSDIKIADKIAAKIQKKFYPTIHKVEQNPFMVIKEIFETTDAQIDVVDYHRNNQLNKDRVQRNIETQISGVGGELYKDFWWLQDFPFYNKKKSDIEKLYKLRIESTSFPKYLLGNKLTKQSAKLKQETLKKLEKYHLDSNTKTYDNIYFNYKMKTNAGIYITLANQYFDSYAPLLEYKLVKLGFYLKRKQRFYNNFHRQIITENSDILSKIRTTEGITCSNSAFYKISDIIFYITDRIKRLTKLVLRKMLKKTYLQDSPNNNQIYNACKYSDEFAKYLSILQKQEIINQVLNAKDIPNRMVGKVITLGLLIERIQKKKKDSVNIKQN